MSAESERSLKISFLGDIALNGRYPDLYKNGDNPFESLTPLFREKDFVVGNLESMAKGSEGENLLKAPRLTTTTETLHYLNDIHLDVACIANNHVYDHLYDGFCKTVQFFEKNSIQYMGAGQSETDALKPVILEKNGIRIGLLNYVTADTNPNLPEDAKISLNYFTEEKAEQDILKLKTEVDHLVISLHWGGRVEGGLYPDFDQPGIARRLIDHGADLIVGHHSHTFQPYEVYKGKYIFYSLGNFCFSDYSFEGKYHPLWDNRRISGILNVNFRPSDYEVNLDFYYNYINRFESLKNYSVQRQNRWFRLIIRRKLFWHIYYFKLKYLQPLLQFLSRDDLSRNEKMSRIRGALRKKIFNDKKQGVIGE